MGVLFSHVLISHDYQQNLQKTVWADQLKMLDKRINKCINAWMNEWKMNEQVSEHMKELNKWRDE